MWSVRLFLSALTIKEKAVIKLTGDEICHYDAIRVYSISKDVLATLLLWGHRLPEDFQE
jgi:hypothetical protein